MDYSLVHMVYLVERNNQTFLKMDLLIRVAMKARASLSSGLLLQERYGLWSLDRSLLRAIWMEVRVFLQQFGPTPDAII